MYTDMILAIKDSTTNTIPVIRINYPKYWWSQEFTELKQLSCLAHNEWIESDIHNEWIEAHTWSSFQ